MRELIDDASVLRGRGAAARPCEREVWELDAARWRLDTLRSELPVAVPRTAELIGGASNDAWTFSDLVLRVCWRADRDRMVREARLLERSRSASSSRRCRTSIWLTPTHLIHALRKLVDAPMPRA